MISLGIKTLLVVDDETSNLESLERIFTRWGRPPAAGSPPSSPDDYAAEAGRDIVVLTSRDGKEALEILRKQRIDVLLTDLMMPGLSGLDLLKAARKLSPETEVILMTAYGTIETAVEAMKDGAYDFITKPLKRAHILRVVGKALERQNLVAENRALRSQLAAAQQRPIVGQSLAMRRTLKIINSRGLHARASAKFVNFVAALPTSVKVEVDKDGNRVNGLSIMGLMMLGAAKGDSIDIIVSGEGADAALTKLVGLVKDGFGED